jgi:hypothetical protein
MVLNDKGEISFDVSDYNENERLIIDPLVSSTFVGGGNGEFSRSIKIGPAGSVYITGQTLSSDYPTTPGAYDEIYNLNGDVFVSKLSNDLNDLEFSTYVGGSTTDEAYSIEIDASGNMIITGSTLSSNFPITSGVYDEDFNGSNDLFVTKIESSGSALLFSTFIGGDGPDFCYSMDLDNDGNIYLTGKTSSNNFPVSSNAFDRWPSNTVDGFVTKLNANGTALVYSTYLGDLGSDKCWAISIDQDNNATVTGETKSFSFPTTTGAFDEIFNGGTGDLFITKFNNDASALIFSTFVGGDGNDIGKSIYVDDNGNSYVCGETTSSNFPTTPGVYNDTYNAGYDLFLLKINSTGSDLYYSSYFGGSNDDHCGGITVDINENTLITGYTESSDFDITGNADFGIHSGLNDAFLTKFKYDGTDLVYSSYIGGSNNDWGKDIILDNFVYVTGETRSSDFPTSTGAYDQIHNGDEDVFISKFDLPDYSLYPPSNLVALAFHPERVDLSWNDNSDNEDGFIIERQGPLKTWEVLDTVGTDETSYMDLTVVAEAAYEYRLKAFNSQAESEYSNTADITLPSYIVPIPIAPLDGAQNVDQPVEISWGTSEGALQYRIELSDVPDFSNIVFDLESPDLSVSVGGLDLLTVYYWRVRAIYNFGQSNWSEVWWFKTSDVVPVELISFNLELIENIKVELAWITATETNNLGFAVERKSQNHDWEQISFVKGFGNSIEIRDYLFIDVRPPVGFLEYRLKQIDFNGKFVYSNILSINIDIPTQYNLEQNRPNPFNPTTKINYTIPESGRIKIEIFNMLGQKVEELENTYKEPGNYSIDFDAGNLSSGIYYYSLSTDKFYACKKMILLK